MKEKGTSQFHIGNRAISYKQFLSIKELRENGVSGTKIAQQFGLNRILIYAFFKEEKVFPRKQRDIIISNRRFSFEELENVFQKRIVGESIKQIAASIGVNEKRLVKVFQKYNITSREKLFQEIGGKVCDKETYKQICTRRLEGAKIRVIANEFGMNENALVHFFLRHKIKPNKTNIEREPISKPVSIKGSSKLRLLIQGERTSIKIGGKDLTKDNIITMIEQRKKGFLLQQISQETGIDRRALQYFFSREGIHPIVPQGGLKLGKKIFMNEKVEEMKNLRLKGESVRAIGLRFNINQDVLKRFFEKENVIPSETLLRNVNRIYQVNHDFFINHFVSSADEAYILGLIITDGSIDLHNRTIEICLRREDMYLLEKVNELLGSNRPIFLPNIQNDNRARLRISSMQIFNDLIRKGIDPSTKSFTARFPRMNILPEKYQPYFIRGVFDGDGWVSVNEKKDSYKIGFIGTRDLLEGIQEVLMNKCSMNPVKISPKSKTYLSCFTMTYGGKQILMKFYDFLYGKEFDPARGLCLRRKWKKMKGVIQSTY